MTRILLVEDDLEICEILQFYLLEKEDYHVTVVHSAEQALPLIRIRKFDLVLLDIMLKGMDGIDFCRELRKTSYCPVIFISCINDDETIIRALNMGGDDYLVKPFQASVLMARIEANLRRCRMTHEEIEKTIGVDSLGFLPIEDLPKITCSDKCRHCTACFNEKYPTAIPDKSLKSRYDRKLSERESK